MFTNFFDFLPNIECEVGGAGARLIFFFSLIPIPEEL